MSLFKGEEIKIIQRILARHERRLDAADADRRRIKDNQDKLGGELTDLTCRLNKLEEAKKHGRKKGK